MADDHSYDGVGADEIAHRVRVGVRLAVALASLVMLIGSGLAWATYKNFSASIKHGDPVPALAKGQHDADGKDQNILLLGNDSRAGATKAELRALSTQDDGGSVNTDTMMLLHVPAGAGKATVISFPRDSWVDIPDNGKGKINAAYGDGYVAAKNRGADETARESAGIRLLMRTITGLTGLHVDHYVEVNLLGFYRISNAIGGVQVNLCQAQHEPNSGINLPKGHSTIKGKQALAFVRQRYNLPNGDLDRIRRQQYFLSAAFRKVSSAGTLLNPFKLQRLLKAVNSSLQMDNSLDPLKLAEQFQNLSAGNLIFKTVPTHGTADNEAGSVVVVDPAEVRQFAADLIGGKKSQFGSAKTVAPGSFTVDVLNASTIDGAASRNADALRQRGFQVGTVGTVGTTSPATVIKYPAGMQAQAKTLAGQIPGAQAQQTSSVQRVTLLLGADGLQVTERGSTTQSPTASATKTGPKPTSTNGMTAADTGACIN